jgi:Carboxypeptidase regulatory-like domain
LNEIPLIRRKGAWMRKVSLVLGSAVLLVVFLGGWSVVKAQEFAGVTGIITDAQQATVPGVKVDVDNPKTGLHLSTVSNDQGQYQFQRLAPGPAYVLTFTKDGFRSFKLDNLAFGVNTVSTYNISLQVGEISQTVEVTSSGAETLNTTDATVGNVFGPELIESLPVQFRDSPAALLGLQPGVVTVGTDSSGQALNDPNGNREGAVTGARADQGNITIDGIDANDQATGQAFATVGNLPIDAVEEFRGITAGVTADLGRSSGAQIQLVTKSGTNDWHGAAYEYQRNTVTEANTFFNNAAGVARPALIRNQFGGDLGGPVKKDRLFFFFNYEGRRDASQDQELRIVPLNNVRNGQLNYINNNPGCDASATLQSAPQCISTTPLTGANSIQALDPAGIGLNTALQQFVNGRYPAANDLTAGDGINTGGFRFNAPFALGNNTYVTRVDFNITKNQRLFGRFNIVRSAQTDDINSVAAQFPGDPAPAAQITDRDYSFAIGHTWNISSNKVNEAVFGISSSRLGFPSIFQPSFPNSYTFAPNTNGTGQISNPFPSLQSQFRTVPVPTLRDDFTWIKGRHTWQFGGVFKPSHQTSTQINDFNFVNVGLGGELQSLNAGERPSNILTDPNLDPGGVAVTEWDQLFPFLLGRFASVSTNFNLNANGSPQNVGAPKVRDYRYFEYEGYAQDQWRVKNSLTLTLGLRYQYFSVPYEVNGLESISDIPFQTYLNDRLTAAAQGINGDTAIPFLTYDLGGKANNARGIYNPDRNNFSPRVAFAYNPGFRDGLLGSIFGEKKTVVRGGATLVYDRVNANTINFIQDQVSYLFNTSATTNFGNLATDPRFTALGTLPVTNVAQPVTHPLAPFVNNGVPVGNAEGQFNYTVDPNFRTPFAYVYSFGVQRELPAGFTLEVGYVGRLGRKLFAQADAGQAVNFLDSASGQHLFTAFNNLSQQLRTGQPVTPEPWFENQCFAGCTQLIANALGSLVVKGDLSDTLQALNANGLIANNSGLAGQFSSNAYIGNFGSSSYNGLLVTLKKRLAKSLQFDFNYTFSRSIDNVSSVANTVVGGLVCDATNLRLCRGPSDFDVTHLFSANGVYDLPFGRGHMIDRNANRFVNALIGGWQFATIFTAHSGFAFSTNTGAFPVGFVFDSPAVQTGPSSALGVNIHDDNGVIQLFSDPAAAKAALSNPFGGEIGNRNNLRGPGFVNFDMSLSKRFLMPWSDKHSIQFRAEAYNAFNHTNFADPSANINSPTFGQITSQANANRVMQFALRYQF